MGFTADELLLAVRRGIEVGGLRNRVKELTIGQEEMRGSTNRFLITAAHEARHLWPPSRATFQLFSRAQPGTIRKPTTGCCKGLG